MYLSIVYPASPWLKSKTDYPISSSAAKNNLFCLLQSWFYRLSLLIATGCVIWGLFMIQGSLQVDMSHPSLWQTVIRWSETVWIIPVPVAFVFWIGWLLFAQPVQPDPVAISVPLVAIGKGQGRPEIFRRARLVFRFITRGDNAEVLQESVSAVYEAFKRYTVFSDSYAIEIVSECPIDLPSPLMSKTTIFVVPKDYVTANKSRFKARAMTYLQEQTSPKPADWHIYLDEESTIDEVFIAGIYHFISQTQKKMQQPGQRALGIIGQGTIIYHGGNWFFRAADAMRTGDDLGRFRLQYAMGIPIFGMHGSFIVVRGIDDARLPFDVGPRNSIAEDAAWALHAWSKGYRFAWVNGYLYEQPPQSITDFVKQRSRWLIGIRGVLGDKTLPLRYRLCLGIFTYSWHLSLLPTMVAVLAIFTHTIAFTWVQVPANFSWAVFFLSYLQGMTKQVDRSSRFFSGKKASFAHTLIQKVVVCPLSLGVFWYTLLEAYSIFYSCLRPRQGFFVIRKPRINVRKGQVVMQ